MVASCLWATSGLFSRMLFDSKLIQPRSLAALRVYGAALILAPVVLRARPRLNRSGWTRVALFGVFGVSVPQWVYFEAIARLPVPITLVIVYTAPIVVTLYERVVHHHVLPARIYVAIGCAFIGVIMAVTGGEGGAGKFQTLGIVLAIITTFAYAGQILVAANQPKELPALVRTGLGMAAGCVFWLIASPIWLLPWTSAGSRVDLGPRLPGSAPVAVLAIGIIILGTVVPYTMLVSGAPRIGLGASAVTGMIEPVFASILAWIVLDQRLTVVQSLGVAVALISVTVAEMLRYRKP
jgi:drug/metabolite transporter (DMT)-like permease